VKRPPSHVHITPGGAKVIYNKDGVPTVIVPVKKAPKVPKAPGGHEPAIFRSHATLQAFDSGAYLATIQLTRSPGTTIAGVPVSRGISAGLMVAGHVVAVIFFDHQNSADSMIVGVS
jgi:hypothetical protein